jgi:hypothetical protein
MSRPTAPCALCRTVKLLAESHFLPKAHYKLIRDAQTGKSAFVGSKESVDTTRQVKKYLVCDECEDRFKARGENWVCSERVLACRSDGVESPWEM